MHAIELSDDGIWTLVWILGGLLLVVLGALVWEAR